jgi:hypothetical protein
MRMALMGRIKRSSQQSDHLTSRRIWNIMAQNENDPQGYSGAKGTV